MSLADLITRPDWFHQANCKGIATREFFPDAGELYEDALRACVACTVRRECLNYAIDNDERGIWGATSHRQRMRLQRQRSA